MAQNLVTAIHDKGDEQTYPIDSTHREYLHQRGAECLSGGSLAQCGLDDSSRRIGNISSR